MQGKICMVTGANSGIGKATALALAQMGATVVMVCRDRARGEQARSEITTTGKNNAVALLQADLSSQQSTRQLVETFQHHYPHLHVLINNAGATFPGRRESVDGVGDDVRRELSGAFPADTFAARCAQSQRASTDCQCQFEFA